MAITLNQNEIYAALSNMIISQEVFGDPLGGLSSSLVDRARVDGGLYGDTKLYVSTDALRSYPWGNDAETANLLRPTELLLRPLRRSPLMSSDRSLSLLMSI